MTDDQHTPPRGQLARLRAACDLSAWAGRAGACQWCDTDIPAGRRRTWCSEACRRAFERNHVWRVARAAARRRDRYTCRRCGRSKADAPIEVNHIVPVAGTGYGVSCKQHLSGLETLCHDCHVAVTAQQRAAGLLARPDAAGHSRGNLI